MAAHSPHRPSLTRAAWMTGLVLSTAALAAGCAQQREEGYYDQPTENSLSDSQYQSSGAGYRSVARAPSQIQFALKRPEPTRAQQAAQAQEQAAESAEGVPPAASDLQAPALATAQPVAVADSGTQPRIKSEAPARPAAGVRPELAKIIPQAQTYLGTLPCLSPGMKCDAQRAVLTLAPNGRWRSRLSYLSAVTSNKPVADQGCWDTSYEKPPRILLLDAQGNARAEFVMAANNVLQLRSVAGQRPALNYTLTRQPDLDPIDELGAASTSACQ